MANFLDMSTKLGDAAIGNDQLDLCVLRSSKTLSYKNHISALYRMAGMMLPTFERCSSVCMLLL